MLEPGYNIESECKKRLTSLFKKVMPEAGETPSHGEVGVEHHAARLKNVFGCLDAVEKPKLANDTQTHDQANQSKRINRTRDERNGNDQSRSINRNRGVYRPPNHQQRSRPGFVRVELGLKKNAHINQESVMEFLNEVRSRKGKPSLQKSADVSTSATFSSSRHTKVTRTASKRKHVLPSSSLRLDHLEEEEEEVEDSNKAITESVDMPQASKEAVTFRNAKSRKKWRHERVKRADIDDED